jgi:hypothetical protein
VSCISRVEEEIREDDDEEEEEEEFIILLLTISGELCGPSRSGKVILGTLSRKMHDLS